MSLDYFRGWVAITTVQLLGMVIQVALDSDSLQRAFFTSTISRRAIRPYVTLFLLTAVQQIVLKALLQVDFQCRNLHLLHGLGSLTCLIFFAVETFLYEYFQLTTATATQLGFNGITVLWTCMAWSSLSNGIPLAEPEHRPRRLIAKHYMETQVRGLNNDADALIHELNKKTK